jgi:alpha-ribazole phosphatase
LKLWLVRHAEVQLAPGICYGATDVLANHDATVFAAQNLVHVLPAHAPLVVSTRQRAQQLARQWSALNGNVQPWRTDSRLDEINFGQWEMTRWDEIPKAAYDTWIADFAHARFGGVESTQDVIARVAKALDECASTKNEEMVWITHAGVIRAARYVATFGYRAIQDISEWPVEAPIPGQLIVLNL